MNRSADQLPGVRITKDDEAVFFQVWRRRLITADDLYRLFPARSTEKFSKRLKLLSRARYLWLMDLKDTGIRLREGRGANPRIFALDYRGAQYLSRTLGIEIVEEKWHTKNSSLAWKNVPHALGVTEFMASHELATRRSPTTRLVEFDELLKKAPSKTKAKAQPQPERFRTRVRWNEEDRDEGIMPDEIFSLHNTQSARGDRQMYYLYEEDNGNETIVPGAQVRNSERFFRQSSYLRKFVLYHFAFQNDVAKKWFGFSKAFRVLHRTTSRERMENMQAAFSQYMMPPPINASAGMNLFVCRETYDEYADDVLAIPWKDEKGRTFYIDDRIVSTGGKG